MAYVPTSVHQGQQHSNRDNFGYVCVWTANEGMSDRSAINSAKPDKSKNAVGANSMATSFQKPYTIYQRSTFIEDHLVKGTDIFLLSRIVVTTKILQGHYERMDI